MFKAVLWDRTSEFAATRESLQPKVQVEEVPDEEITNQQVVLDVADENLIHEREQEIGKVIDEVNYIHDIMNQIQVLTVEQGSLLDRIDVNLDTARVNLQKTVNRLEKTADRFSVHQKRLIIFFLTLLIFSVSLGIFFKR